MEIKKENKAVTNIPSNFSKHIHNVYLIEDILYYQHNEKHLVIVPLEIQTKIIKFSHCTSSSGHFGIHKTHNTILNKFCCPKLLSDVKEYINNCFTCNRVKHPHRKGCMIHEKNAWQ